MSITAEAAPQVTAPATPEPVRTRAAIAAGALATSAVGVVGVVVGALAIAGRLRSVDVGWLVPLIGVHLGFDALGGLFAAVTGAVAVPVGIYTLGYARRTRLPAFSVAIVPVFVAAMILVPLASSVGTFLLAWELMAITSLMLVLTDHRHAPARAAGVLYAVLTQLGFLAILAALVVLSASTHSGSLAALADGTHLPAGTRAIVAVLTLVGFGSKLGLVPLHAWLPRAHPEAPSPVSALMSAAMVNLGVYGLLRFDVSILAPAPRWFGVTLMIVGGASALFGALQACVSSDAKQLLAYSTIENLGLIVLAVGVSVVLAASGLGSLAAIAMTAALLHVLAHAAFKTLAFLCAGSVLAGTGLRDLDAMGGLGRRMPTTATLFGIAALGASGLPLGAGFVSEWLLAQSLLHAPRGGHSLLALALPLAVGVIALSTGLAVVAMVKAFGIGFLARPRSVQAADAHEATRTMLLGSGLAGLACLVFAVAPGVVAGPLRRVLVQLGVASDAVPRLGALVRLPGVSSSISPPWLVVALLAAAGVVAAASRWGARRRVAPVVAPLWACGADELTARMQYTATSFAEPLQRVFDDVLRPETDIVVSHAAESRYLVDRVAVHSRVADALEERLYRPAIRLVQLFAAGLRRAHNGSIHTYLGYGALGLLVVLVVAR